MRNHASISKYVKWVLRPLGGAAYHAAGSSSGNYCFFKLKCVPFSDSLCDGTTLLRHVENLQRCCAMIGKIAM